MEIRDELTVVIKTILRPAAVRAVVDRFVSVLGAGVPVLVVDDSPEPIEDGFPPQVTVIPMEYDSGLSAGRNCGIAAVRTSRVFLADDDCLLESSREEVLRCLEMLDEGWDLIGSGAFRFEKKNGALHVCELPIAGEICDCEITKNFFVAKTELLCQVPWDDRMKTCPEHADHFLRLCEAGAKVGGTELLRYRNLGGGSKEYRKLRSRNYMTLFTQKWGMSHVVWEAGSQANENKVPQKEDAHWFEPGEVRRLHVSTGRSCLQGWLNLGSPMGEGWKHPFDFEKRLPFAENSFDLVYMDKVIERQDYKSGFRLLRELWRVLRPGGRIRLTTFDLDWILELRNADTDPIKQNYLRWVTDSFVAWAPGYDASFVINHYMREWGHRFLYDMTTLSDALESVGFFEVVRVEPRRSGEIHFRDLEDASQLPTGFYRMETLILEATKPS